MAVEALIVRLKREYPGWGAPKLREKLRQQLPARPHYPVISTVHAVLDRHGLMHRRRRRRPKVTGTALSRPTEPNALWCADYKGEFMLANRRYCYPRLSRHVVEAYRSTGPGWQSRIDATLQRAARAIKWRPTSRKTEQAR